MFPAMLALVGSDGYKFALFLHILAVVLAFGPTFGYALFFSVAPQHPRATPAILAGVQKCDKYLVGPGMLLVLAAAFYLLIDGNWDTNEAFISVGDTDGERDVGSTRGLTVHLLQGEVGVFSVVATGTAVRHLAGASGPASSPVSALSTTSQAYGDETPMMERNCLGMIDQHRATTSGGACDPLPLRPTWRRRPNAPR